MHAPLSNASPTSPELPSVGPPATPTPATSSGPRGAGSPEHRTEVVARIADDGQYMDGWVWAAELAQASHASLRLLSGLAPMPDMQDRHLVELWMSARHVANARLTAALLAVRRRYPAVHVTSQLCTEGAALVTVTSRARTDTVVLPKP
jgi:hypothetical protein